MSEASGSGIAIVGMAGRFPGARDVDELWRNLAAGVESIRFFSPAELEARGVEPELRHDPRFVPAAAVADGVDTFDAPFFGMTAREAELIDPQHRVLLETAWQALEHAGYDSGSYPGAIGVYAGATINTYLLFNLHSRPDVVRSLDLAQLNIANGRDFLATRVSYKLNLKGPSHLVQSACSTSLVAVHVAAQSLYDGQCDLALAGGVSVNVKLMSGYRHVEGGITSPDGHCRAFDERAAGTVFGGGAGVVVLKRLEEALADGDTVHAVLKGSAINNDGAAKVGFTAPSVEGQAKVIAEALADAGVAPETVGYVETHGTGTALGDPIEVQALKRAFGDRGGAPGSCALGSVKSNLGHLDAAAGVTSLIKTVLALRHGAIPPSLHFERPNPELGLDEGPFFVNTRLTEWRRGDTPRRAGVSSFGVGGTNAHVVLEEAPLAAASGASRPWHLLVLSAFTETALGAAAEGLAAALDRSPEPALPDVAYTLAVGRRGFRHRRVVVCAGREQAVAALREHEPRLAGVAPDDGGSTPVAFVLTGAAAGGPAAVAELHRHEPVFRRHLDATVELARTELCLDLSGALAPDGAGAVPPGPRAAAGFAAEHALAQVWLSWGVRPQAMLGRGGGEYVAACLAGALALPDALALAALRGELGQDGGGAAAGAFAERVARTGFGAPRIPFVSSLTGAWVGEGLVADPGYWTAQLEAGGGFGPGLATLLEDPARAVLVVAGGEGVAREVAAHAGAGRPVVASLAEAGPGSPVPARLLAALGGLWLAGASVDWGGVYAGERRHRVPLPTYPFERQRYWIEALPEARLEVAPVAREPRAEAPREADRAEAAGGGDRPEAAAVPAPAPATRHPRPALSTPFAVPSTPLERSIARVWQDALGLERVGVDDVFFELGGDSLVAVQVMDELSLELGRPIPAVSLYEELTVRALAELLAAGDAEPAAVAAVEPAAREGRAERRKDFQERMRQRKREQARP